MIVFFFFVSAIIMGKASEDSVLLWGFVLTLVTLDFKPLSVYVYVCMYHVYKY